MRVAASAAVVAAVAAMTGGGHNKGGCVPACRVSHGRMCPPTLPPPPAINPGTRGCPPPKQRPHPPAHPPPSPPSSPAIADPGGATGPLASNDRCRRQLAAITRGHRQRRAPPRCQRLWWGGGGGRVECTGRGGRRYPQKRTTALARRGPRYRQGGDCAGGEDYSSSSEVGKSAMETGGIGSGVGTANTTGHISEKRQAALINTRWQR